MVGIFHNALFTVQQVSISRVPCSRYIPAYMDVSQSNPISRWHQQRQETWRRGDVLALTNVTHDRLEQNISDKFQAHGFKSFMLDSIL